MFKKANAAFPMSAGIAVGVEFLDSDVHLTDNSVSYQILVTFLPNLIN
jgi:hypothetical protein